MERRAHRQVNAVQIIALMAFVVIPLVLTFVKHVMVAEIVSMSANVRTAMVVRVVATGVITVPAIPVGGTFTRRPTHNRGGTKCGVSHHSPEASDMDIRAVTAAKEHFRTAYREIWGSGIVIGDARVSRSKSVKGGVALWHRLKIDCWVEVLNLQKASLNFSIIIYEI